MTDAVLERLEAVCSRLERIAAKGGAGAGADADPEVPPEGYLEFKAVWDKEGKDFLQACNDLPNYPAKEDLIKMINDAFETIMKYMALQNKCKKPKMDDTVKFCQPMLDAMNKSQDLLKTRDKALWKFDLCHRAISEMFQGCTWVSFYPPNLPVTHLKGAVEGSDFQLTKIMMKEPKNKPWAQAMKKFMHAQLKVVETHYKMGIEFCGKEDIGGVDASAPPPAQKEEKKEEELESKEKAPTKKPKKKVDGEAMLAQLQQGLKATSGLKKVDKSQKNKYNRANIKGTVSVGPKKAKSKKKLPDPKKYKQGPFTWFYQYYQEGLTEIEGLSLRNGIYICNSLNCNFRVTDKIKSVVIDSCQRVQIEVNDIVSSIELVNCKNVTVWCKGKVPNINLDKSESPRVIFVTKDAWELEDGSNPQIVYSNCSAANIEIPDDSDDRKEVALAEQFVFSYKEGKAEFVAMEHGD